MAMVTCHKWYQVLIIVGIKDGMHTKFSEHVVNCQVGESMFTSLFYTGAVISTTGMQAIEKLVHMVVGRMISMESCRVLWPAS